MAVGLAQVQARQPVFVRPEGYRASAPERQPHLPKEIQRLASRNMFPAWYSFDFEVDTRHPGNLVPPEGDADGARLQFATRLGSSLWVLVDEGK